MSTSDVLVMNSGGDSQKSTTGSSTSVTVTENMFFSFFTVMFLGHVMEGGSTSTQRDIYCPPLQEPRPPHCRNDGPSIRKPFLHAKAHWSPKADFLVE